MHTRYLFPALVLGLSVFAGCTDGGDVPRNRSSDRAGADALEPSGNLIPAALNKLGPPYDLKHGRSIFKNKCLGCHGTGFKGAPEFGDAAAWSKRVEQDLDTLIQHALKGHGAMPPKGGFSELSDSQVAAAVAYVVKRSQRLVKAARKKKPSNECHPINNPPACSEDQLRDALVLQMMWMLRGSDDGS